MNWDLYWTIMLQITIACLCLGPSIAFAIYVLITPISNSIIRASAMKRASIEVHQSVEPVKESR